MLRKPDWIRVRAPGSPAWAETRDIVRENKLVTVCEEAGCPNIGECWSKKHATFMILGDTCTRACAFCNVRTGLPGAVDPDEPAACGRGASPRWAWRTSSSPRSTATISTTAGQGISPPSSRAIRARSPETTIEVLTPDFLRKDGALETVVAAKPDVFNHNLETVPSLYLTVRPGARYFHSIRLLQRVKELDPTMFTKSGIMVGLGEERNEVLQLMDDLRTADVDFLTIGQYLQPTRKHHPVKDFVTPEAFKLLRDDRLRQGLSARLGEPADALLASCRRGFRAAPRGACRAPLTSGARCRNSGRRAGPLIPPSRCSSSSPTWSAIRNSCRSARRCSVRGRRKEGEREMLVADMTIGYKLIRETFTTKVTLDRPRARRSAPTISTARSARWRTTGRFKPLRRRRLRDQLLPSTTNSAAVRSRC